jgi:hypothetical protein
MKQLHKTAATAAAAGALGALTMATAKWRQRRSPSLVEQAAQVRERYRREVAKAQGQPDADAGWAGVASVAGALRAQAVAELNELRSQYRQQLGRRWYTLSPRDRFYICMEFSPEGVDDLELEED